MQRSGDRMTQVDERVSAKSLRWGQAEMLREQETCWVSE